MRIGIDARMYRSGVAGIGRYSQNLIKNLLELDQENEYVLFMTDADKKEFENSEIKNSVKIENLKLKIVTTNIAHYSLAEQIKLPKILAKEKLDLMHFLNFNYPVCYKGKFIPVIHDLTLIKFPSTAKKTNLIKKWAFSYVLKKACQNSVKVIAISEHTKRDIVETFKIDSRKIKVIYEASDDKNLLKCDLENVDRLKKKYKIDTPAILYVGQFRPHKNLPSLVDAFSLIHQKMPCKLVLLGKPDPDHKRLQASIDAAVDKAVPKDDIIMPGFVSDEELACWYKIATVFVFPSLYEGFGLPGLEAMQMETPVVAANNSVLPEIYQDAAIYFDPFETADIADKIKMVLASQKLQAGLIQKGKERVKHFSWRKMAEETLDLYRQIQN